MKRNLDYSQKHADGDEEGEWDSRNERQGREGCKQEFQQKEGETHRCPQGAPPQRGCVGGGASVSLEGKGEGGRRRV